MVEETWRMNGGCEEWGVRSNRDRSENAPRLHIRT